jgi:signal peptidase I
VNDNQKVVKNTEESNGTKAKKTSRKSSKINSTADSQNNIAPPQDMPVQEVLPRVEEEESSTEEKTVDSAALSDEKTSPKSNKPKRSKAKAVKESDKVEDAPINNSENGIAEMNETQAVNHSENDIEETAEAQENDSLSLQETCNYENTDCEEKISEHTEKKQENSLFPDSSEIEDANEYSEDSAAEENTGEEERILPPDELFAITESQVDIQELVVEDSEEDELSCALEDSYSSDDEDDTEDDGQYTFEDLAPHSDASDKIYEKKDNYDPKKPRKIDGRFDIVELFVFTLLAVMIVTSFFFRHSIVKGESMENTLHDGEHLIISDFLYTPERGDIIVCEDHTAEVSTPIVKRVIAIGGDRIKITADGEVYVNGELIDESDYVYIDAYAKPHYRYTPLEMTVPKGELFVMGDHRNNSTDSRDLIKLGTISEDAVLGKVLLRFYPISKFGTVD